MNAQPGKAGQSLTENDWLMSIRSRVSIPGGACGFDLPAYYAWQHKSGAVRREQIEEWASSLAPLAESIFVLMKLLRDQSNPQKIMAEKGQFQQHLPLGRVFQLARILIDSELGLIPETSGNRLIVSIRLVRNWKTAACSKARTTCRWSWRSARENGGATRGRRCLQRHDPRSHVIRARAKCQCARRAAGGLPGLRRTEPLQPAQSRTARFAAQRCKNIDFGAWSSEQFRVAADAPPDDIPHGDPKEQP